MGTSCHKENVARFYNEHNLSNINPKLLFNADETPVEIDQKRKVFTTDEGAPIVKKKEFDLHMTTMIGFSASGVALPPFIILPTNLKNLPADCVDLGDVIWFATSKKGYMTQSCFKAWCVHFVHWCSHYRTTLDENIRSEQITLLLDVHPSRINFDAIRFLECNNIQLIIFPSNITSILQPYDAHVGHLFKTEMRNCYQHHKALLEGSLAEWREARPHHRVLLVRIILLAWKAVANQFTLKKRSKSLELLPGTQMSSLRIQAR